MLREVFSIAVQWQLGTEPLIATFLGTKIVQL